MKKCFILPICFSLFCATLFLNSCVEPSNKKPSESGSKFYDLFSLNKKTLGEVSASFSWDYQYNDHGLPSKITYPGGRTTELSYEFYYGDKTRIKKVIKKDGDGIVSSNFDLSGNLVEMQDKLGQVTYEYDPIYRPIKVSRANLPSIAYTYNTSDQITSLSMSNGYRIDYKYDFLGRLTAMSTPAGEITYTYLTGDGFVERQLPNGIRTQYKYFPDGKLEYIVHADKNGKVLVKYSYTYNPDGLISAILEWTRQGDKKFAYEYDNVQRLTGLVDADGTKTNYSYDEFGNRTEVSVNNNRTESYTYDGLGRILTCNEIPCEYDNSGNLITDDNGEKKFNYNSSNQLIKAANASYEYSGDGTLFAKVNNNQKTTYYANPISDIWQPLASTIDGINETFYIWEGDRPIAAIENGKVNFFLTDHLGSVREIADKNGDIIQQINYSPFGIPDQAVTTNSLIPGFTGLFYEPEAKLYLTRARAYDPNTGRFLQIDPLHQTPSGTQKDFSLYAYCGADPVNNYDINGTQTKYTCYSDNLKLLNSIVRPALPQKQQVINDIINRANKLAENNKEFENYGKYNKDLGNGKTIESYSKERAAWRIIMGWRNDPTSFKNNFPNAQIPNESEWQSAEHRSLIRQQITTGIVIDEDRVFNRKSEPGRDAVKNAQDGINKWKQIHLVGETFNISPSKFDIAKRKIDKVFKGDWGNLFAEENIKLHGNTWLSMDDVTDFNEQLGKAEGWRDFTIQKMKIMENFKPNKPNNFEKKSTVSSITIENPKQPYQSDLKKLDDYYPGIFPSGRKNPPSFNDDNWNEPPGGVGIMRKNESASGWSNSLSPSNVGGIYLGGAGKAFEGIGKLSGIALDESNGKLVLISEDKGKIDLPPLRLDDVVTIFRSVYIHGEAPSVSIDPDSLNPKGPIMKTRHGAATDSTYVGWILFEADRIMKAYSLGEDNITKKSIKTKVAGYDRILDVLFSADTQGPVWERFWIVPSSVTRNRSSDQSLTLLDVPLMVKTQRMVLKNGKMETAANGKSSKGAEEFSKWFTAYYDQIANESLSMPPVGSEMTEPVPVFKELQRIALITAIAEQLRDRGIALPFWMRGYKVKSFPTPETTPTHTVTKDKGNAVFTVFGGVNLSPSTDQIITKAASPVANSITPKISEAIKMGTYLQPVAFVVSNKNYQAAVIPGNDTKDLGPCVLTESDLSVPVTGKFDLSLIRKYNSFITPLDNMFGKTWSLDLPFLEAQKIPVKHLGDKFEYDVVYNLITPLNSFSERIDRVYETNNKLIGFKTSLVTSADGTNLYFNNKGFLVAYEEKPMMILYNRDSRNKITQIVGISGQQALADIKLEYNKNLVAAAKGSNGESVKYVYSDKDELIQINHSKGGMLGQLASSNDNVGYEYTNGMVTVIKYNDETTRQFNYNEKGQLLGESSPNNPGIEYRMTSDQSGSKVTTYAQREIKKEKKSFLSRFELKTEDSKEKPPMDLKEMVQYDQLFRPLKKVTEDGTVFSWDYSDLGFNKMEISWAGSDKYQIKQSKDGRNLSYSLPNGINYDENYNEAGQLVSLIRNNQPVFQQQWNNIGKLDATVYENSAVNYEYNADGALERTLITPPGNSKTYNEWLAYSYDRMGNVAEVSDFTGMKTKYVYDAKGEIAGINSTQGGIKINRNKEQINSVETSWGTKINYVYDQKGNIQEVNNSNSGNTSYMKFADGQISEIAGSNGSKYSIDYYEEPLNYLVKKIKTPVNKLEYNYSDQGDLQNVICNNKYEVAYLYDDSGRIKQIRINGR